MAVNDKLNEQYKEQLKSVQALERFTKNITSEQKAQLKAEKAKLTTIEKRVAVEEAYFDSFDSFARDYKALGKDVQKQLTGQAKGSSSLVALNQQIAKEKKLETRYSQRTSDAAKAAGKTTKQRLEVLESINGNLTNQAKATQTAQDDLLGTSELTRELRDLEAHRGVLTNEQLKIAKKNLELKDQLKQKQEVLTELQKQQGDAMSMLPAGLQSAIGGARTLGSALKVGLGPLFVIGAILVATLKSFTDLEDSAKGFRETTGLTNSQMEGMRTQAIELQRNLGMAGVDAEKLFGTMSALTSEFSDIARFSDEVIGGLTLLNTNFGISADSAAKVQGIFEQVGGLSSETATSVAMQATNMANLAGVAPAKIFEDIADNAEIASTFFHGDVEALTKAAVQARRLGTNLKSVASTTEHLLDFQSNIGDELVAATFVGGQFSLTQARSLAAAGKSIEANKEVLRQLERGGKFRDKDYFTQRQLAKAAGMSVEEINKQLNAQEKLSSLNDDQKAAADIAISQGLDISNINKDQLASQVEQFKLQQETQGQVDKLSNAFKGVAASLGTALIPALDIVLSIITPIAQLVGGILNGIIQISTMFGGLPGLLVGIIPILLKASMIARSFAVLGFKGAIAAIFRSFAAVPFGLGIPLAIAGVAGLGAMMKSAKGTVGTADDMSGVPSGYGNTMVTTAGKGTLALNNNDSFVAGTNLGGGGGNDAKMDMLIAAVKQTKDVYMDGRRVTSRVASSVEKSSKNQYGFG
jgi:hypothetical protein